MRKIRKEKKTLHDSTFSDSSAGPLLYYLMLTELHSESHSDDEFTSVGKPFRQGIYGSQSQDVPLFTPVTQTGSSPGLRKTDTSPVDLLPSAGLEALAAQAKRAAEEASIGHLTKFTKNSDERLKSQDFVGVRWTRNSDCTMSM
jgi:hypothetical protein